MTIGMVKTIETLFFLFAVACFFIIDYSENKFKSDEKRLKKIKILKKIGKIAFYCIFLFLVLIDMIISDKPKKSFNNINNKSQTQKDL